MAMSGGMDAKEGWNRTLVYAMSVFEDVATVRHVSAIKSQSAQIWGSFRTTELLDEYMRLRFMVALYSTPTSLVLARPHLYAA